MLVPREEYLLLAGLEGMLTRRRVVGAMWYGLGLKVWRFAFWMGRESCGLWCELRQCVFEQENVS